MQCELLASGLAAHFGIGAPEPALVWIEAPFAALIAESQPSRAARMRSSVGLNFGTRQLNDVTIWPVDRAIPEAMWQAAVNIFSFDALIENPDRRTGNPNLFSRGDDFLVYDHEMAFSFLLDILPSATPMDSERSAISERPCFLQKTSRSADRRNGVYREVGRVTSERVGHHPGKCPARVEQ
jgi:hypothetical protein